jgi:hypothetical protein
MMEPFGLPGFKYKGETLTGYMSEMRKLIGHRTIIQCAASIMCVDEQGRILMGKRSDNHLWGYSGGSVEIDEYVEECARRELEDLRFFSTDEIDLELISPPIRPVFEKYLEENR